MNSLPFNSGAFNGSGSNAAIVYLPSATATLEIALHERISVSMSGGLDMGMAPTGDISKVLNLGSAPSTITRAFTGSLTLSRIVSLDSASIGFGIDVVGTVSGLRLIPSGDIAWNISPTGDLSVFPSLSGSSTSTIEPAGNPVAIAPLGNQPFSMSRDFVGVIHKQKSLGDGVVYASREPTGNLSMVGALSGALSLTLGPVANLTRNIRNSIPSAVTTITRSPTGYLRLTGRLSGTLVTELTPTGSVARIQFLTGEATSQVTLDGDLSNNADGEDIAPFLMTRKPTNREMTR